MELIIEASDGVQFVRIGGELDTFAVRGLLERMRMIRRSDRFVVDLGGLSFIDSAGLHALFSVGRSAKEVGATVVYVAPLLSPVRRVIDLVLLGKLTPVCESVEAAMAFLLRSDAETGTASWSGA